MAGEGEAGEGNETVEGRGAPAHAPHEGRSADHACERAAVTHDGRQTSPTTYNKTRSPVEGAEDQEEF